MLVREAEKERNIDWVLLMKEGKEGKENYVGGRYKMWMKFQYSPEEGRKEGKWKVGSKKTSERKNYGEWKKERKLIGRHWTWECKKEEKKIGAK